MSQIITKQLLKETNSALSDTLAAIVADGINGWIENLTSRCWGEKKTVTERYNASGVIWLNHMDITEIVSVKTGYPQQSQEDVQSTSYYWTPDGRLDWGRNSYRLTHTNYVEVEYSYGVPKEKIPYDLTMAALGMATAYADWIKNSGKTVDRAQVGSYSLQFAAQAQDPTTGGTVTRDLQVVNSYKLRRV